MKYALPAFFALLLSGCWWTTPSSHMPMGASPLVVWGAGETISVLATGKLMEDHLFSAITDKNCSLERKLSGAGNFCMTELELERAARPDWSIQKVYCYQSIAQPTCYNQPSPYPTDILIGVYDKPVYPTPKYH